MATTSVSLTGIEESLLLEAEKIFAEEGLTASDVYRSLLRRTVEQQRIPLDLFRPNAETLEAMRELESGGGKSVATVAELMADLHADD